MKTFKEIFKVATSTKIHLNIDEIIKNNKE